MRSTRSLAIGLILGLAITTASADGRKKIREAVESRYTLPESAPMPIPGTDAESIRKPDAKEDGK